MADPEEVIAQMAALVLEAASAKLDAIPQEIIDKVCDQIMVTCPFDKPMPPFDKTVRHGPQPRHIYHKPPFDPCIRDWRAAPPWINIIHPMQPAMLHVSADKHEQIFEYMEMNNAMLWINKLAHTNKALRKKVRAYIDHIKDTTACFRPTEITNCHGRDLI